MKGVTRDVGRLKSRRHFLYATGLASVSAVLGPLTGSELRRQRWQPDGWGSAGRIGMLIPAGGPVPESEFAALAPPSVSIHAAPVPLGVRNAAGRGRDPAAGSVGLAGAREFADSPKLDEAAALLARTPLNAIAYCFTSSSYVLGGGGDSALARRLEKLSDGIPVVITSVSATLALRALRARRLALVHPPWFASELDRAGASYFRAVGFDVIYHAPTGMPYEYGGVDAPRLYEWARANVPKEADALFVGGNGFRAIGAIQELEETLSKPVLTANQVTFWHALRAGGVRAAVAGYGRIFDLELPGA